MAKRNRVTVDLKIAADAQLKNSKAFISQLDNILDSFDFGDKINKQLQNAKNQLIDYNKILEKVQHKSIISDEEIKTLSRIGKEMTNLVNKTEKLYNGFNSQEIQQFSKEYIAQVKKQEAEIAKIKQEYTNKTGKIFDKEIQNLDKYKSRIQEIKKEINNLESTQNVEISKGIEKEQNKIQQYYNTLEEIQKIQEQISQGSSRIYNNASQRSGFSQQQLQQKISLDANDITTDVANMEYKKIRDLYVQLSNRKDEILAQDLDEKAVQEALLVLAKEYKLIGVSNTQEFNKQLELLEKQKNYYRLLDNRSQLATEQLITAEMQKRQYILSEQEKIAQEIARLQKQILSTTQYTSMEEMKAKEKAASRALNTTAVQVTTSGAKLTQAGEDEISNNIISTIKQATNRLTIELNDLESILQDLMSSNDKIAVQSERQADEKDIYGAAERQIAAIKGIQLPGSQTEEFYDEAAIQQVLETGLKAVERYDGRIQNTPFENSTVKLDIKSKKRLAEIDELASLYAKQQEEVENRRVAMADAGMRYTEEKMKDQGIDRNAYYLPFVSQYKESIAGLQLIHNLYFDKVSEVYNELLQNIEHNIGSGLAKNKKNRKNKKKKQYDPRGDRQKFAQLSEEKFVFDQENLAIKQGLNNLYNDTQKYYDLYEALDEPIFHRPEINSFSQAFEKTGNSLNKAAAQAQYLGSAFDDILNRASYWFSLNAIFEMITRTLQQAVEQTKDIDKDMVQIGLVLGKTSSQVWQNFDAYSLQAERLSVTTSELISSMKLFYQQGLSTVEVNKMIEASAIAAALGESTMAEASETLTSLINSYGLSANEAMMVTDKISQISIVSAADFGELSVAIEKVASSAASAGLDLDHMMGYLAKMIETTREAPTNIGTALKTIVANFSQFREDPSSTTEDGTSINDVDEALASIGINLLNAQGEMRDLGEVIDELGKQWDSLSRSQRSYLATMIAGTRQQSRFYALMNDYDRTLELVAEGSNSSGKASQQFSLYQDSLTSSTKGLSNELEKLRNNLIQEDSLIHNITKALTALLKIINKIPPLGTVLLGVGLTSGIRKGANYLSGMHQEINRYKESIRDLSILQDPRYLGLQPADILREETNKVYRINNLPMDITPTINIPFVNKQVQQIKGLFTAASQKIGALPGFSTLGNKFTQLKNKLIPTDESLNMAQQEYTKATYNQAFFNDNLQLFKDDQLEMSSMLKIANEALADQGIHFEKVNKVKGALNFTTIIGNKYSQQEVSALLAKNSALKLETFQRKMNAKALALQTKAKLKYIGAMAAVAAVTMLTSMAINKINKSEQEEIEKLVEASNQAAEKAKNLRSLIKQYDELNNKMTLTNQEMEEFINLRNQIAEEFPDLINYYDQEGNAVLDVTNALQKYNQEAATAEENAANAILQQQTSNGKVAGSTALGTAGGAAVGGVTALTAGGAISTTLATLFGISNPIGWVTAGLVAIGALIGGIASLTSSINEQSKIGGTSIYYDKAWGNGATKKEASTYLNSGLADRADKIDLLLKDLEKSGDRKYIESRLAANDYNAAIQKAQALGNKQLENEIALYMEESAAAFADVVMGEHANDILGMSDNQKLFLKKKVEAEAQRQLNNGATDDEIKEFFRSQRGQNLFGTYRALMLNVTTADFERYGEFIDDVASGEYSVNFLQQQVSQLNGELQSSAQDTLAQYRDVIDAALSKINFNNFNYGDYSLNSLLKLTEAFNNATDKEREALEEGLLELERQGIIHSFMEALDELDSNDLQQVEEFKNQYQQALGQYGLNFFDALFTKDFSLSKFKTQFNNAFKQTTDTTAAGINYSDIMAGKVSQENSINALTNKTTGGQMATVGKELLPTGDIMRDSIKEGMKNSRTELLKYRQNLVDNYQTALTELSEYAAKEENNVQLEKYELKRKKALQDNLATMSKQVATVDELIKSYSKLDMAQQAIADNNYVITGIAGGFKTIESVRDLVDAYAKLGKAQLSQLDIVEMVAQNSELLVALQVNEQGQLELTKEGLEELTRARLKESRNTIAHEIEKIEIIQAQIDLTKIYTDEEIEELENVGQAYLNMAYDANQSFNKIDGYVYNFVEKLKKFGTIATNVTSGVSAAWGVLKQAVQSKDFDNILERMKQAYNQANANNPNLTPPPQAPTGPTSGTKLGQEYYDELEEQKKKLQALLKRWDEGIKNPGEFLKDIADGADGFEQVIDKLEKFYNYLRKLESIERRLSLLQTKQAQIDLSNNYDISLLDEENRLLKERYATLMQMVPEQEAYLESLRQILSQNYSEWISFDALGNTVLSQTEFVSNSESEKERYDKFNEIREEYEKQLEDAGQRHNSLFETQNNIVENIASKYEKLNQQLEDEKTALTEIVELEQHRQELSFRDIFSLRYYESILDNLQNSYDIQQNSFKQAVNNVRFLDNELRQLDISKWVQFDELTQQWHYSAQYTIDLLNEDTALMAQIANIQSLLSEYEKASEYLKTAKVNMQEIESTIKSMVDGVLSDYESALQSIVEQNTEILDGYKHSLDVMKQENELYEGTTKELQKYYNLTIEAAGAAKYAMESYQESAEDAIDSIMDKYSDYVTEINGQYAINEIAAQENLTTSEIQELNHLIALYKTMNDAANESQDQFLDYMDAIKEMEEAKRDAIIDIMQQVRDELQNIDQEELNDLKEKYDEMNRLDNEYYSSLSQKIDDARKKRDRQQTAQGVAQLQNQIAVLERDSSGAYSTELRDLRQQLTESLQTQADQNIDDELERIQREQEERQQDREIQITQMENLISFKEENGMYWDQAYDLWADGRATIESFLADMYARQDLSKEEIAQKIQETNATLDQAWVRYGEVNAQKIGEQISPIAENLRTLKTEALPRIEEAINNNESYIKNATETVVRALAHIQSAISQIHIGEDNADTIEQMMNNGKKWEDASEEERKQLNATNKALGSTIGLTYDAPTGLYYDKYGQAAYNGTNKTQYNPKYDIVGMAKASDQMQANGEMWREDMTPAEKNAIHEKNVKLAAPYGWYYDSASGEWYTDSTKKYRVYDKYKDGGYVDYTGIAQVDGTPSKPEAFLNAQQTQLFEQLRDSLAGNKLKTTANEKGQEGDNIIINTLEISVKEIADADSIDKVVKTVKQSIYKDATSSSGITKVTRR